MCSQEQLTELSQVRYFASAGSKAAHGSLARRANQQSQKRRAAPPHPPLQLLRRLLQGLEVQWLNSASPKTGVAGGLVDPKLSLMLSMVQGISNKEASRRSPLRAPPSSSSPIPAIMRERVDVLVYLDLLGLVWVHWVILPKIGSFPVGDRLLFFLPAWERITSDQFVLMVVRQGSALPFVRSQSLALDPSETPPLLSLQF